MLRRLVLLPAALALLLAGSATAQAQEGPISPSPAQLEFGAVDIHFGGSPRQALQFANSSFSMVGVSSVEIAGPDASRFQLVGDGCSGVKLGPNPSSCTVEVAFTPEGQTSKSATLQMSDDEGTVEVPLYGSGITGEVSASPSPLGFAPIPYTSGGFHEGQNETKQVNIQNGPGAGTQVEGVDITGPDAASFSVQYGNCEHNLLAPGNQCSEGIQFQPTSPGPKHAQLVLTSDSAAGPLVVALEGEGLMGPRISMSSYQSLLGDVMLGTSTGQTFVLTNTGDYPLGVQQAFLVSGTPLMFPILSDACSGNVIRPASTCALTVGFTPTTPGEKNASLLFITSGSLPVTVVGLSGVGVQNAPAPATIIATPEPPRWLAVPARARAYVAGPNGRLQTGVTVRCPARLRSCEIDSFIKSGATTAPSPRASGLKHPKTVLLGGAIIRLAGGASARLQIPLAARARRLLGRGARLPVVVGSVIRADGGFVASRSWPATLLGSRPEGPSSTLLDPARAR